MAKTLWLGSLLVLVFACVQVQAVVTCTEHSDCTTANPDSYCNNGACHGMDCIDVEDCNPNALYCDGEQFCVNWQCIDGPAPCAPEICQETGGGTGYCEECQTDEDCDDGIWCNGAEACSVGNLCEAGSAPCGGGTQCNEDDQDCTVPCVTNAQCDNGLFCDGVEICDLDGRCLPGTAVCDSDTQTCDEAEAVCVNRDPQEGNSDAGTDSDGGDSGGDLMDSIDEYIEYAQDPENRVVVLAGAGVLLLLVFLLLVAVIPRRRRRADEYKVAKDAPSAMGDGQSSVAPPNAHARARTLTREEAKDHLAVLAQVAEIARGSNVNLRGRGVTGATMEELVPEDYLPKRRDSDVDVMSSRSATVFVQRVAHNGFELLHAMFAAMGPHELDPMAVATIHVYDYISDVRDLLVGLFAEEVQSSTNGADMMRATAPAARLMSYMFQTYGTEYRTALLKPIVAAVMSDPMLTTHAVYKPQEYPAAVAAASSHTANLITAVASRSNDIPFILRDVLRTLKVTVSERFPERTQSTIADAFFLKFICPALANPFAHGLTDSAVPPHKAGVFVSMSKLANTIAQGGRNPNSSKKQPLVDALELFVNAQAATISNFIAQALPTNLEDSRTNHIGHETSAADARKGLDQMRAVLKAYEPTIQATLTASPKAGSVLVRDVLLLLEDLPPKGGWPEASNDDQTFAVSGSGAETIRATPDDGTHEVDLHDTPAVEDASEAVDRRGSVAVAPSLRDTVTRPSATNLPFEAKRDIAEAAFSLRRFPSNADVSPNAPPAV